MLDESVQILTVSAVVFNFADFFFFKGVVFCLEKKSPSTQTAFFKNISIHAKTKNDLKSLTWVCQPNDSMS